MVQPSPSTSLPHGQHHNTVAPSVPPAINTASTTTASSSSATTATAALSMGTHIHDHEQLPQLDNTSTTSASSSSSSSSDSIIAECVLPQYHHHRKVSKILSAPINMPAATGNTSNTYVFPSASVPTTSTLSSSRGHGRSISHGGGAIMNPTLTNRPPATTLKSALRGHQRAFSQGQITVAGGGVLLPATTAGGTNMPSAIAGTRAGHSRVGSKTDFILPPGHKEAPDETTTMATSGSSQQSHHHRGGGGVASGGSGGGHSRQASRSESIYTLRRAEMPPWWHRFVFCGISAKVGSLTGHGGGDEASGGRYRTVVPNHTVPAKTPKRDHPNGRWVGNKIRTTKYTLLSFIPKNLLEQFHRVANLYFIFIVLLNWFPAINAFGKEIAMIPVLFVLGVTAIKDLFEDRRRRASDQRINNTTCRVYCGELERYKRLIWQEIRVGDIVHLSNNETVPADILLLRSSGPQGVCYIDTCDLDGESNLKRREVVRGFVEKQNDFAANKFMSRLEVDAPSTKIYRFHGAMVHATGERVPVSTENLLLRESRLKNTDFVEGLVVYAGHETKAMLNNSGPRYKRSQLEQQMNIDVIWCVILLIIMCVLGAFGCKMWLTGYVDVENVPFLPFTIDPGYEALITFWTFVIILQIMIPLSLYVTIELCKLLQVYHIHNNVDLFCTDTNKRSECRAMNITEELGQIQYIFSDKTGTLTENKMIFRRCAINGVDYNHPETEEEKAYLKPGSPIPPILANCNLVHDMGLLAAAGTGGCVSGSGDNNINNDAEFVYTHNAQRIHEFLLVMAICNTVVVSAMPHRDSMNASGVIEDDALLRVAAVAAAAAANDGNSRMDDCGDNSNGGANGSGNNKHISDRYTRLAESRSITPSPPPVGITPQPPIQPPNTLAIKQSSHVPSLSPISSSTESSPTSEGCVAGGGSSSSPKKRSNVISPTAKAKSIIVSKFSMLTSVLQTKSGKKSLLNKKKSHLQMDRPIYEAESPDELALVNAAYTYGCCLINRSPHHTLVNVPGDGVVEFEVLKVLPFDSTRKCMSIVVRRIGAQEVVLYTKGADNAIMKNLVMCMPDSREGQYREQTQQLLDNYAKEGLRVLVLAKRKMTIIEYNDWYNKHKEIEMCMANREKRLRESFSSLERNLTLLGATGIEDRLQEGVPEAIASLRSSGIVIWVLTGDKPETAINVAYSAKLFSPQMEILKLTARSRDAAETSILFYLAEIEKQVVEHGHHRSDGPFQRALVVDGKTLTYMLDMRSNLVKPFLKLTKYCSSVLCCRSTPLQKAYLVKVVKEEFQMSTLAIGDGANDVSMIQMADVGVGISGQEGMQAVMASDFTLPRFKFIANLLLIHGFWSYDRLARMILYFFYKNATCVFLIFWYQLFCGFSGAVMIDQMYLMLYNLLFTSLPPLAIGVYDKNVREDLLYVNPQLYRQGRLGLSYRPHDFWLVMLESVYQSLVIFFVAVMAYWGTDVGIWAFGTTMATSSLIAMLLHCAIQIKSWTILHVLSIVISLGAYYAYTFLYGSLCVNCFGLPSQYWVIHMCVSSANYWLITILTSILAVLPSFVIKVFIATLWPNEAEQSILYEQRNARREPQILGLSIRM